MKEWDIGVWTRPKPAGIEIVLIFFSITDIAGTGPSNTRFYLIEYISIPLIKVSFGVKSE